MWRCRAGPGLQRARRWLVPRCPVLAVAYRARRMAPIGVQLVKDVLSLVDGIGWSARVSWRPGHFTPGAVIPAGSDSGSRLALAGYHRDRRGCGAGRLRPPGHSPERNCGHRRKQDEGQRNFGRHQVLHGAPPRLSTAIAAIVPCFLLVRPACPGRLGPGKRLGPHHIEIARVVGQLLRQAALTPDPRCAGTDTLHRQISRHLRRPVRGSTGRLRRPACAGPVG